MLDRLDQQPPDALLALIKLYEADDRPTKIDLGVGVYRTAEGDTPVFEAIKEAEARLLEGQDTKAYLGPEGDMGFVNALMPHIFGQHPARAGRIDGMQTPGGTGAVRLAAALAERAGVERIVVGAPSWPNHAQILARTSGFEVVELQPCRGTTGQTDHRGALRFAALGGRRRGQTQSCCMAAATTRPASITRRREWDEIAQMVIADAKRVADPRPGLPGSWPRYGRRRLWLAYVCWSAVPEALDLLFSCDKNFGLYRDRVGALYVMAEVAEELTAAMMSNAHGLARANWSHAARSRCGGRAAWCCAMMRR